MHELLRFAVTASFLSLCHGMVRNGDDEIDLLGIAKHPLDPLSPAEIHRTAGVIRRHNSSSVWIFNRITLHEPEKSPLLESFLKNTNPDENVPRKSFTIILDSKTFAGIEVVVNLNENVVESWTDLPGVLQPATNRPDRNLAEDLVKNDLEIQAKCRQLGWSNMSLVAADIWPIGYIGDRDKTIFNPGNRLVQSFFYGKLSESDNEYAHPFGFNAIIDLKHRKVISIKDLPTNDSKDDQCSKPTSVPKTPANYKIAENKLRKDLKPVKNVQPGGASFVVNGRLIQWQKFQFRVGFNEREGVIIHHVGYNDNKVGTNKEHKFRPLFYRLSLSETFIPYGDSRPPYQRKAAYDMGELDLGISANELNAEEYCLGEHVTFLNAYINDPHGEPLKLKNAVCVYEDDAGILWKHTDYRTGKANLVRSQRLNVAFLATVGNYDYLFTWHFYQDGTIQYEVRLTGILSTNLAAPNSTPAGHGTLVGTQVNAQYHQHIFAMRIDPEIDGNLNTVGTLDVIPGSAEMQQNPYRQAFTTKLTRFRTSQEAKTYGDHEKSRTWLMMSSSETSNAVTKTSTAYKLVPKHHSKFLVLPDSPLYPKSEFCQFDFWVTPYVDWQLYAGGRYLNNSGLPEWTEQAGDKIIEETDVVLWHIFRVDHAPRVEDYPVMPNEPVGFTLKPFNFFEHNPALDIPPP